MKEHWRRIAGFSGYAVSDLGRVRRGGVGGYIVPQSRAGLGRYLRVALMQNGCAYFRYVHRLVATAFVRNSQGKPEVNHEDGHKDNNASTNLGWVTHAENQRHSVRVLGNAPTHLHKQGADHPMARLKLRDVQSILKRLARGDTQVSIAQDYGVTQVMVSHIKLGKAWKCVPRVVSAEGHR